MTTISSKADDGPKFRTEKMQEQDSDVLTGLQSRKASTAVLIPCYNEETRIASVIFRCQSFASTIYVCDDGSTDLTANIAAQMGAIVLRHNSNMGYGAALRTLFDAVADSPLKVVVTLDGDGQHDPRFIEELVEPIFEGTADIVIGSRFKDKKSKVSTFRKAGIDAITASSNMVASQSVSDAQSGLRAYNVKYLRKLSPSEMDMPASTEILLKASSEGLKIKEIPVEIIYHEGSSKNTVGQGVGVLLGVFKQYSLKHPLLFYGVPGLLSLLSSVIFWALLIADFTSTKLIETNFAILAMGFTLVGFMLITTAMILWTIISVVRSK